MRFEQVEDNFAHFGLNFGPIKLPKTFVIVECPDRLSFFIHKSQFLFCIICSQFLLQVTHALFSTIFWVKNAWPSGISISHGFCFNCLNDGSGEGRLLNGRHF